jgi:protoporphyrinogen oxidase
MKKDPTSRIGIIGAGAAGLTAAESLRQMGYHNITILERETYAGGKCRSIEYEGRSYEMGAGIIAANNKTIIQLAGNVNVKFAPVEFGSDNLYDIEAGGLCEDILSPAEKISFLWQLLLKFRRLSFKYEHLQNPGFNKLYPELCINFSEWAKHNGIELVQKYFERFYTGFGYGYWDEISAAYVLKYYDWDTLKSYIRRGVYFFSEGIQQLWIKIAEHHDVRYNTIIEQIQREDIIYVKTDKGKLNFDVLVVSCPLDETMHFMDTTREENDLFSKILYTDYQTFACFINNFPQKTGFIPAHFHSSKKGHPVFWYKRYADSNLYTMYVLGDWKMSEAEITGNIEKSIKKLGGTLKRIHSVSRWKYFPHVSSTDLQSGFYENLESLQGQRHTYYIGELLNFSTVELTAAYAKSMVEKHF